jgi:hypothetical protein
MQFPFMTFIHIYYMKNQIDFSFYILGIWEIIR